MKGFFKTDLWMWIKAILEIAIIAALVLIIAILIRDFSLADAFADEANGQAWVLCDPESHVCIRSAPRKSGIECGGALCGCHLMTDSTETNGFLHIVDVSAEESDAWISLRYITFSEPHEVNGTATVRSDGRVACRKWIAGKIVSWIHNGDQLTVYWMSDEWAVTSRGYVMSCYLEVVSDDCEMSGMPDGT